MNQIRGCNQSQYVTKRQEKKDNDSLFSHILIFIFASRSCEAQTHCRAMHSLRHARSPRNATGQGVAVYSTVLCLDSGAAAVLSGNSKPTLPSSSFKYAEKARPRFEIKPSRRSVFPLVRSFCACSLEISRPSIVLLSLNLHGLRSACECSQM